MSSIHRFDLLLLTATMAMHIKKPDSSHTMLTKFLLQLHKVWFLKLLVMVSPPPINFRQKMKPPSTSNKKQNSRLYISSHCAALQVCTYIVLWLVPSPTGKLRSPYNTLYVHCTYLHILSRVIKKLIYGPASTSIRNKLIFMMAVLTFAYNMTL